MLCDISESYVNVKKRFIMGFYYFNPKISHIIFFIFSDVFTSSPFRYYQICTEIGGNMGEREIITGT